MKKYRVLIYLILVLLGSTIFWYFGHHRPAQKILNAEPVKKYKTVTPIKPKTQPSKTPGTITSHSHEEDTLEADTLSDQEQNDLRESTEQSRDTSVSQGKEESEDKHLQSKEEQEASKKLKAEAEAEAALKFAEQTQKESLELMRETMPIIVNHLNTLSQDEQRELLQQTKTAMANQISQYPPELQPIVDEFNIVEEGWKMYLDMLAEYGYTPPKGIE